MAWTDEDEQLYRALVLDEWFSSGIAPRQIHVQVPLRPNEAGYLDARCSVIRLTMRQHGVQFWHYKPRRRRQVIGDPLGAGLLWLAIWGPINLVLFFVHVVQWLLDPPRLHRETLQSGEFILTSQRIIFNMRPYYLYEIDYSLLESVSLVSEGISISYQSSKLLLVMESSVAQWVYVALAYLAPAAARGPGLIVPDAFIANAQLNDRILRPDRMMKNGPATWSKRVQKIRSPIPARWVVAGVVILLLIIVNIASRR